MRLVEELVQDARYAMRSMRCAPGFTAVAVLTLALGIGANTAIFSVLYGVWLAPVPYADAGRLVDISTQQLSGHRFMGGTSYSDLADWKAQTSTVEAFGVHRYAHQVNVSGSGEAEEVIGHRVSANLFSLEHGNGFLRLRHALIVGIKRDEISERRNRLHRGVLIVLDRKSTRLNSS